MFTMQSSIKEFNAHHHALDDAKASAEIVIEIVKTGILLHLMEW